MPHDSEPRPPGTPLHADVTGRGPRIVAAHGFTHTSRTWGPVITDLARDHQLVTVDMPGHAASSHVAVDLTGGGRLLAETGGNATYLGYSMGARFCLRLALDRPGTVESLVLISGTAGIEDPRERASRRAADDAMADELDPPDGDSRMRPLPVGAFLERWLEGPLFAGIPPEMSGFAERLRNSGAGLASSLRMAGTGTQQPLWGQLDRLAMPVLVITGADDGKFTQLGRRMVDAIGDNATHVVIPRSGHAPHLQQPEEVANAVRDHMAPSRARRPTTG